MLQLTITAKTSPVVLQDPFPSDGAWSLSVAPLISKSVVISWDQFQRIAGQISALEQAGLCVAEIATVASGEVRGQENDLVGMPSIDIVSPGAITFTGEVGVLITGDQLLAQQTIAAVTLGNPLTPTACITFESVTPGVQGNDISVEIIDTAPIVPAPAVITVVGTEVLIDLKGTVVTAAVLTAAINTITTGAYGTVFASTTGGGGGNVLIADKTFLTGGSGEGLSVTFGGQPCVIIQSLPAAVPGAPDVVKLDTPDLTGIAIATEVAAMHLRSGSKKSSVTLTLV